jgi:hypothetical protein
LPCEHKVNNFIKDREGKWATCACSGIETRKITKLLKGTQKIASGTQKHNEMTSMNRQIKQEWHMSDEMLRLPTKTHRPSRGLHAIFREHVVKIQNDNSTSDYSNHVLNT